MGCRDTINSDVEPMMSFYIAPPPLPKALILYLPKEIFSPASGGMVNVTKVKAASMRQGVTIFTM